jgi:hypothetical protein
MIIYYIIPTQITIAYRLHFINIPNNKNERYYSVEEPVIAIN